MITYILYKIIKNRKAQTLSEYAIVIGIVAAALLSMQPFIQRSIQAVLKGCGDELGSQQPGREVLPLSGVTENSFYYTDTAMIRQDLKRPAEAGIEYIDNTVSKRSGNFLRTEKLD